MYIQSKKKAQVLNGDSVLRKTLRGFSDGGNSLSEGSVRLCTLLCTLLQPALICILDRALLCSSRAIAIICSSESHVQVIS